MMDGYNKTKDALEKRIEGSKTLAQFKRNLAMYKQVVIPKDQKEYKEEDFKFISAESILDEIAKEKMTQWDLEEFKESHPTLFATITEAMERYESL